MKNQNTLLIGAAVAVVAALLLFFTLNMDGRKKRYNWNVTFKPSSDQPYGTKVLHQLLEKRPEKHEFRFLEKPIHEEISAASGETNANYLYLYHHLSFDDYRDMDSLFTFVEKGNKAFICTESLPQDLAYDLAFLLCSDWDDYDYEQDSAIGLNFSHPDQAMPQSFAAEYRFQFKQMPYRWSYLNPDQLCDSLDLYAELGRFNNGRINYYRVSYGEGYFYFFTTPLALTNYNLTQEGAYDFVEEVFAHLHDGPIYWDQYSTNIYYSENGSSRRNLSTSTPLQFILQEENLRLGLYLTLLLALLFLLFRSKRQQRIIPVMERNTNTSLEFIETIGRIYFLQNDHRKLGMQKMKLFLGYVRNRYNIATKVLDDKLIRDISIQSQVPRKDVESIFKHYKVVNDSSELQDFILINFHQAIDNFYKNCK